MRLLNMKKLGQGRPSKIHKVFLKVLMLQVFLPAADASAAPVLFFCMQIFMPLPIEVIFQSLKIL